MSMSVRKKQRNRTRRRIVDAAIPAFAEFGFLGASTRDIAQRAGTNQGLLSYHFKSKEDLWRAATDRIFSDLRVMASKEMGALRQTGPRKRAREAIRVYVRFAAAHPDLFRIMLDEGKGSSARMKWLVRKHLKPLYKRLGRFGASVIGPVALPHAYYVLAGAGSLIFAMAPECRALTGLNPKTKKAIEAHANYVARVLVP
jgi:TetR/AcrR family transcriptional regulator